MSMRKWLLMCAHSVVYAVILFLVIITYRYIRNFYAQVDELGDKAVSVLCFSIILSISIMVAGALLGRVGYYSSGVEKKLRKIELWIPIALMALNILVTLINVGNL
jgi:hypothetical protein